MGRERENDPFTDEEYRVFVKIFAVVAGVETEFRGVTVTNEDRKDLAEALAEGVWFSRLKKTGKDEEAKIWYDLYYVLQRKDGKKGKSIWENIEQVGSS